MPDTKPAISEKLKTDLEKFQSDHIIKFQAVQDEYKLSHRDYWQGIETPSVLPDELIKEKDADYTKKPSDQIERWSDVFKGVDKLLPSKVPATISVDVYSGPSGQGWTITLRCLEAGKVQKRTWNFGPEDYRHDKGWIEEEKL